jgi:hypothetical protein
LKIGNLHDLSSDYPGLGECSIRPRLMEQSWRKALSSKARQFSQIGQPAGRNGL